MKAEGNLIGYINNVDIADGTIDATMTPYDDRVKVVALVENVPAPAGKESKTLHRNRIRGGYSVLLLNVFE